METLGMLGAVVEITGGPDNGQVVVDPLMPMLISALYLFLLLLPFLFILGIVYHKKKFQHEQIMAAMEKGVPISDLVARPVQKDREVNWVRSLSAGIGLVLIGVLMWRLWHWTQEAPSVDSLPPLFLLIPIVVGGLGLIYLLCGIFQKMCEKKKVKETGEITV